MGQQLCAVLTVLLLLPHHVQWAAGAVGGASSQPSSSSSSSAQDAGLLHEQYQAVFAHRHSLSPGHLQRSLAFQGANLRLQRLLARLLDTAGAPQTFHVGVIGGSISWGHGVQRGREDWCACAWCVAWLLFGLLRRAELMRGVSFLSPRTHPVVHVQVFARGRLAAQHVQPPHVCAEKRLRAGHAEQLRLQLPAAVCQSRR